MNLRLGKRVGRSAVASIATAALLASLLAGSSAAAPGDTIVTVSPVADINMGTGNSNPAIFEVIGSTAFFQANDGSSGLELFKSEPPYTSAMMVENINTDAAGGSEPTFLTGVGTTLFFAAETGAGGSGRELWKSVPPYNAASTALVADIKPGDQSSSPFELFNFNGTLLFSAEDNSTTNGRELWKSNGGPLGMGTELVENIEMTMGVGSDPYGFTQLNSTTVLFGAADVSDAFEVWKTDGTGGAGTAQVADINPAGGASDPFGFLASGSNVFFTAFDGDDVELWKSDGTTATEINIDPGAGASSDPIALADVGGTLFFSADDGTNGIELWKSDGGPVGSGTELVANINSGGNSSPLFPAVAGNTMFFRATDSMNGAELWRTNGGPLGPGGTEMVADINPTGNSNPALLTNVNGTILFRATDGMFGSELWRTGGTAATTTRVSDIFPGSSASNPANLTDVNGTLLFSANDDGATGNELWKAVLSTEPFPPAVTPPALTPTTPVAPKKKCKKGRKLKKGKCVKKKRKRKRKN